MLWEQLPIKKIKGLLPHQIRVLRYDPTNAPNQFTPQPFRRHQNISVRDLFPITDGKICGCGCGIKLTGRKTRWATEDCEAFAVAVRLIVYGASDTIARYMRKYYGWRCSGCGCEDHGHDMGHNGVISWIKVDHIIPVKNGGGACWLSNYQLLCHDCHVKKTCKDFKWKRTVKMPTLF